MLVVDDDRGLRIFVREALELEGYTVLSAGHGRAALDHLVDSVPFLMLLDLQMPIMDGPAVLRALAQRVERPHVILMSGVARFDDWCRQSTADACLAKPFALTALLDLVERAHRAA